MDSWTPRDTTRSQTMLSNSLVNGLFYTQWFARRFSVVPTSKRRIANTYKTERTENRTTRSRHLKLVAYQRTQHHIEPTVTTWRPNARSPIMSFCIIRLRCFRCQLVLDLAIALRSIDRSAPVIGRARCDRVLEVDARQPRR